MQNSNNLTFLSPAIGGIGAVSVIMEGDSEKGEGFTPFEYFALSKGKEPSRGSLPSEVPMTAATMQIVDASGVEANSVPSEQIPKAVVLATGMPTPAEPPELVSGTLLKSTDHDKAGRADAPAPKQAAAEDAIKHKSVAFFVGGWPISDLNGSGTDEKQVKSEAVGKPIMFFGETNEGKSRSLLFSKDASVEMQREEMAPEVGDIYHEIVPVNAWAGKNSNERTDNQNRAIRHATKEGLFGFGSEMASAEKNEKPGSLEKGTSKGLTKQFEMLDHSSPQARPSPEGMPIRASEGSFAAHDDRLDFNQARDTSSAHTSLASRTKVKLAKPEFTNMPEMASQRKTDSAGIPENAPDTLFDRSPTTVEDSPNAEQGVVKQVAEIGPKKPEAIPVLLKLDYSMGGSQPTIERELNESASILDVSQDVDKRASSSTPEVSLKPTPNASFDRSGDALQQQLTSQESISDRFQISGDLSAEEVVAQVSSKVVPPFSAGPSLAHVATLMLDHPLGRHVALQVASAAQSQPNGPMELTLSPEELGRVHLVFHHENGSLSVSLTIERPETLDLMRRHIETLAEELRNIGFREVNIGFGEDHSGQRAFHSDNRENQSFDEAPAKMSVKESTVTTSVPAANKNSAGDPGTVVDIRL